MRNVDGPVRVLGQEAVLPHFGALVVRQGAAELNRYRPQCAREGVPHRGRVFGLQWHQQRKSRGPFDQRAERRRIRMADEQVALPMPWYRAICHFGWPLVDADQILNRPRRPPYLARPTKPMSAAQIPGQFPLERARRQRIEIRVDVSCEIRLAEA